MGSEELSLEHKCENLMNGVVERRKRFRKTCVEYEHKSSIIENKILNLHLETISKYNFKSKNSIAQLETEDNSKDIDDFTKEMLDKQRRIDNLKRNLKTTQQIVLQLKNNDLSRRAREPLSVEVMLTRAKNKKL